MNKQLITKLPFNLSPKLVYTLLSYIVAWAITHYTLSIDPEFQQIISLVIASAVGYKADPGEAIVGGEVGPPSDSLLSDEAKSRLGVSK